MVIRSSGDKCVQVYLVCEEACVRALPLFNKPVRWTGNRQGSEPVTRLDGTYSFDTALTAAVFTVFVDLMCVMRGSDGNTTAQYRICQIIGSLSNSKRIKRLYIHILVSLNRF